MRVLFLTTSYPLRAGDNRGVFVHELARRIAARGHRVGVVAARLSPASAREEWMDGVRVVRVPVRPGGLFTFEELSPRNPWTFPGLASYFGATVAEALRPRVRWDVIHAQWDIPCGIPGAALRSLLGRPLVTSARGFGLRWSRTRPPLSRAVRWVLERSDRVLAVADNVTEELLALGLDPARLRPIRRGIDTDRFAPRHPDPALREVHGLGGRRVLLFVGDLIERKGVRVLVRSLARVAPRHRDLVLVAVGDGPLRPSLEQEASRLGVGERIRWMGHVPPAEIPRWYNLCEAFALPSLAEAAGNAAMEALACGRPVILAETAGKARVLHDAGAALLVKPGDDLSLAEAIEYLLENPETGRTMGERGLQLVRRDYTWDREVEETLRAYDEARETFGSAAARR